jgi:hypothetical protein
MKQITYQDIVALDPCYEPSKYIPETWTGTVVDILDLDAVPANDRLWVVLHSEFLPDKLMRLFAVRCARQVQHLLTDERSIRAIDVAERYANGLATDEELTAAWAAASDAARDAVSDAARDAARAAASDAARAAARDAVSDAVSDAQVKQLREMILADEGVKP